MNNKLVKIGYKDCLQWILWISLFQGVITSYLGFAPINYICDFLLIMLLIIMIATGKLHKVKVKMKMEYIPIFCFAMVVIVGWMFNPAPILMAIWALRNYGRFFLYFILCNMVLGPEDVDKMEDIFVRVFPIHIAFVAFQYIVEGLNQDRLSGIFGNDAGGNGGLMIYLTVMMCIIMARYEYKRISLLKFIIYLLLILVNAALSELKYLFIVAVILLVWYLLMSKRKGRGMVMALAFIVIIYIGAQVLYSAFPEYADFLDIDNILNQVSAQEVYASKFDVGRTSVFSKLSPIITRWAGKDALWLGIGLGNGDYSSAMSFLDSAFFKTYEPIHYTWFSLGYLFVETGYLGTISYTAVFVVLEISAIIKYKRKTTYRNLLGTFIPLTCLLLLVYNSTLRSNYAYMIFAVLSWGIIEQKNKQSIENKGDDYNDSQIAPKSGLRSKGFIRFIH